jgi:hypothetical protein
MDFLGLDNRLRPLPDAQITQNRLQSPTSPNQSPVASRQSQGGKEMLTREVAVFVCAFAFMIGFFAAVGLLWWSLLWALIGASLALVEYLVWRKTGKTLSEQFGQLLRTKPDTGWLLIIVMSLGFILLIWHLIAMR